MNAVVDKKKISILGGTGFVGRALCKRLLQDGHDVSVITRGSSPRIGNDLAAVNLKVLTSSASIDREAVLAGQDVLVNLSGILHESRRQSFHDVHVEWPASWTLAAHKAGLSQVLHMSALRADMENPPSAYLRSKAAGERAVIDHASGMTIQIFRPSIIFGEGDNFFGQFASLLRWVPVFPLVCPNSRFAPVWVEDVASAFANALGRPGVEGPAETYNLCGPRSYRFRELIEFTAEKLDKRRLIIGVPDWIAQLQGRAMECLPNPLFTLDNFYSLQADSTCDCNDFAILGIEPESLERVNLSF